MGSLVLPDVESLQGASPDELAAALRQADMIRSKAEVVAAEIVGLADRSGAHLADGHRHVRAWATATCNWSLAHANVVKQTAQRLHGSEIVGQAATGGRLGVDQLHTLARGFANRRAREWFEPCAKDLVEQAAKLPLGDFCVVARRWESYADPDGSARTHERANLDRDAHIGIVGNQVVLDAHGGVEMVEIFERFRDVEFATDWHSGVVADIDTYEHHLANTAGLPTEPIDPRTFLQRRCETVDGHQIAGADLVAASLAGHVRRVIFNGPSAIIDIGRKRRLFTGPLRDVLALIDRTCLWPGCGLPTRHCQSDHIKPWATGGATSAANGGPACGHHNRFKHRNRYHTWRDQDGAWHITRPDSTQINAPPDAVAGW